MIDVTKIIGFLKPHNKTGFKTLDDLGDLTGKRALLRVDLNVPMMDGRVTDDTRIQAIIPSVKTLLEKGAQVVLLSHFGRPKGKRETGLSLMSLTIPLHDALGVEVTFVADCVGSQSDAAIEAATAPVILIENLRFHSGEESNNPNFAAALAKHGDIFVSDAFSCVHRTHASIVGIANLLPSYAGASLTHELNALEAALGKPEHPVCAVVGGAKVSSKLDVLTHLVEKVDHLIIGGGMANTFLAAQGHNVGSSLCEHNMTSTAKAILEKAAAANCTIHLPTDVVVAQEFKANADHRICGLDEVGPSDMILDAGPTSIKALIKVIEASKTLIWNGPMGAFELTPFDTATVALAQAAGKLVEAGKLMAVAGGGDTVAAMAHAGVKDKLNHVSTAGGAFLEWMEGKALPGIEVLKN
jgi:phosphoglycerate kinase